MRICLKQKIIALLLTIFMTLTLLPIYANAEVGGDGNAKETLSPPVQLGDDVTARGGLAPMSINPDHAFVVNETSYETLQQAIDNAISGDVIALQKTITDYVSETVVIDGKNITIDLGNENLTIHKSSGLALEVRNCTVSVKGSGKFNVSGGVGIHADRATITVHNVIGAQGNGVYAYNGGNITVLDNATGYSSGVKAESGGIITVHGSVSGYSTGVFASGKGSSVTVAMNVLTTNSYSTGVSVENGAYIEVGNDVKSTADNSTGVIATFASEAHIKGDVSASFSGVQAEGVASQVTVDKNITVSGANATGIGTRDSGIVNVLGNVIAEGIGSKGIYVGGGTVTVAGNVSASKTGVEIGVYGTGDVTIRGTLTVLDISHIYIKLGSVTFNSGNYITNPDMPGYHIYTDGTSMVRVGDNGLIAACKIGTVNYVTLDGALTMVEDGQTITLLQDIDYVGVNGITIDSKTINFNLNSYSLNVGYESANNGIIVKNGGKLLLLGDSGQLNVTAYGHAVVADGSDSSVTVTSATSKNNSGAYADGGEITVTGNVTGYKHGAFAKNKGKITIGGNAAATAKDSGDCFGARAESGGIISITGTAESEDRGIYSYNPGSKITVGNVVSNYTGTSTHRVAVQVNNDAEAFILGNCTIHAKLGTAIEVASRGQVTIDGSINHNGNYIRIYTEVKDGSPGSRTIPTTKTGYHTYSTENGTVWVKDEGAPPSTYTLTVQSGTGGGSYAAGAQVPITADSPAEGKVFDKWISSGGGSFKDANSSTTTFTMPSGAVTVTAIYKDAPLEVYTLTVLGSYSEASGAGQYASGMQVSIHAGSRSNYSFTGWTSTDGIIFANKDSASTTFTMPDESVTVTANWHYNGDGNSGGSSSVLTPKEHNIIIEKNIENGSISVNLKTAKFSETVIITVKPDNDFNLGELRVTDNNGKDIKIRRKSDDTYTFKMPEASVTIEAEFVPIYLAPEISPLDKYIDIKKDDWYYESVEYVVKNGLMLGTASNLFSPSMQTSRAMIITILYRFEGSPETGIESKFSDLTGSEWYAEAVAWAEDNKIVSGFPDGTFKANDVLTREQLATILYNYSIFKGSNVKGLQSLDNFSDGTTVSGYAKTAMEWAVEKGIITGIKADLLSPVSMVTRAQMTAILQRYSETIVE